MNRRRECLKILLLVVLVVNMVSNHRRLRRIGSWMTREDTKEDTMSRPGSISSDDPAPGRLLGCEDMPELEQLRELGKGEVKQVYQVKLPWGGFGVAKRCVSHKCVKKKLLQEETAKFLRVQHHTHAVKVLGTCFRDIPAADYKKTGLGNYAREHVSDFAVGPTIVVELGTPLLNSMDSTKSDVSMGCLGRQLGDDDVEDLVQIARMYAAPGGNDTSPMLLGKYSPESLAVRNDTVMLGYTDNHHPLQYVHRQNAVGTLLHSDMDNTLQCNKFYDEDLCTYAKALTLNCLVISQLTRRPMTHLDCVSDDPEIRKENNSLRPGRINATYALERCYEETREKQA